MSLVTKSRFLSAVAGMFLLAACASSGNNNPQPPVDQGPAAGSQEDLVTNVGDRIFFCFDCYNLNVDAQATLRRQAVWMKSNPGVTVAVEGNCDERGTREYNLALGARRANAAKDFLVAQGVDPARISTISYGKERPTCMASNEECWAVNRNSTTRVAGGAGS